MGSFPIGYPSISTSDLTLATEEVRDLWQVRVGDLLWLKKIANRVIITQVVMHWIMTGNLSQSLKVIFGSGKNALKIGENQN
jgi:hypothetical protein